MKKLLSLLSVLTISGTAVPTTIAAIPYQKEENINSEINYSETNNLEKLNRNKRQDSGYTGGWMDYPRQENLNNDIKNKNLGIIKNNYNKTLIEKIREVNGLNVYFNENRVYISDKTSTSATIVPRDGIGGSYYNNNYMVTINYFIEDDLNNTNLLLTEWNKNFKKWNNEINRQINNDVPSFTLEQKRTWKDDKNFQLRSQIHSLNQNINIIMNNFYIKQLINRVQNLENDLSNLKYKVETLSNADLTNCSILSSLGSSVISIVPVVGSISSAILGVVSAGCSIANS